MHNPKNVGLRNMDDLRWTTLRIKVTLFIVLVF